MRLTHRLFSTRTRAFLLLAVALSVVGCKQGALEKHRGFMLRSGDLLFQDTDSGPLCEAIEKVTTGYRGAKFTHVGIVSRDGRGGFVVIEASSDGVGVTPLQAFLDRSSDAKGRPKVVVGRLKPAYRHLIPLALEQALALKGKPYDKLFVINTDSYYCSELIYDIFLRANENRPIFSLQPMTFRDPETGAFFPAWNEYFAALGVSIPEGEPGINPGGISRSPVITIVHAYGIPQGWTTREFGGK